MSTLEDLQLAAGRATSSHGRFPADLYTSADAFLDDYAEEFARAARSIERPAFQAAAALLLDAYSRHARVFCCGNGGSASIANHMQCDHTKGVRTATDLAPRIVSLSTNVELLTAIANDLAYEDVFVYQLQSQAEPGDVLLAVSSSGRSPNIVRALTWARDHGLRTIGLTGFDGGSAKEVPEVTVHVDSTNYGVVEDVHQAIMHALAQYIRQSRMTPDAISVSVF